MMQKCRKPFNLSCLCFVNLFAFGRTGSLIREQISTAQGTVFMPVRKSYQNSGFQSLPASTFHILNIIIIVVVIIGEPAQLFMHFFHFQLLFPPEEIPARKSSGS